MPRVTEYMQSRYFKFLTIPLLLAACPSITETNLEKQYGSAAPRQRVVMQMPLTASRLPAVALEERTTDPFIRRCAVHQSPPDAIGALLAAAATVVQAVGGQSRARMMSRMMPICSSQVS